jgi:hypothetical protein
MNTNEKIKLTPWKKLPLSDNLIFCDVMERNPDVCKELLEMLLSIEKPATEKSIQSDPESKSVRMDVYVKDGTGRTFDAEKSDTMPDEKPLSMLIHCTIMTDVKSFVIDCDRAEVQVVFDEPADFMFQLEKEEIPEEFSKSQIVILNERGTNIKKMPYAFTEQGIYMLATVLKGKLAEQQSIFIMCAFREMRHYIKQNRRLFGLG